MATNRRDVELAFRVTTLGEQGIARLEQDVRDLAEQGGAAAPQFAALADRIAELAANAKALDQFGQLAAEVRDLSAAQNVASETAQVLYTELRELEAATAQYTQAERAAKDALRAGQRDLDAAKDALRLLRLEYKEGTIAAEKFDQESIRLRRTQLAAEQQVRSLRDAYASAKQATRDAAQAETEMERRVAAANREAERGAAALNERNEALREARGELAAAGVATDDLSAAQAKLVNALNAVGREALEVQTAQEQMAAAAREQAQEEERLAGIMLRTRNAMADAARAEADSIIADFERMRAAERAAAQEAEQAALTIANAFKTVGAKSAQDLEREIADVRTAMNVLRNTAGITGEELDRAMRLGNARIRELERDLRMASGQMSLMDRAATGLKTTLGQFTAAFGIVEIVQRLGSGFLDTNKQMERMRLGLGVLYRDANLTAQQIDFLRSTANTAGVSFNSIGDSFLKFSASTKAANIPLSQTNELFAAVTRASATLGLSGDKVSHMLDALSQMAAKGVVSMEELRQQLGDSLPGALSLTAQGLGLTDQELIKLVESGGLLARDLFPALTRSLQTMTGPVNTLTATWERFKNILAESANNAADAGVWEVLKAAIAGVGVVIQGAIFSVSALIDSMLTFGRVTKLLSRGELAEASAAFDDFTDRQFRAGERLVRNTQLLFGYGQAVASTAKPQERFTRSLELSGTAAQTMSGAVAAGGEAMRSSAASASTASGAQERFGATAEQAAARAALAGKTIVQLASEYASTASVLENATQVAEREAKARQVAGRTLEEYTKLTGDQRASLNAATQAAEGNLAAQENLAAARQAEVEALRIYIQQLSEEIRLRGDPDGARKRELQERQKKLDLLKAESTRTKEAVDAAKLEVDQRKLTAAQYEDNSESLELLRNVMEQTNFTLNSYIALQREGFVTQEQVTEATRRAAVAAGLYRDALADAGRANERAIQAVQNRNIVEQAALGLDAERQRSLQSLAEATNNQVLATQAQVSGIEIEIRSRERQAAAMQQEITLRLKEIEDRRTAQVALGEWNVEKEAEYQKTRATLDAKRLENEALKESTNSLRQQAQALRDSAGAQNDYAATIDSTTNAIKMQNKALEELYNRNRIIRDQTLTNDGFKKNADGSASGTFTNMLPVDKAFALVRGEITDLEEARAAFQQAQNAYRDMEATLKLSPSAASVEYQQSTRNLFTGARTALERLQAEQSGVSFGGQRGPAQVSAAESPKAGAAPRRPVMFNVGGITVASQDDADRLTGMLSQLEDALARSA